VAYLGFGKGGAWRARGARAYNRGLGAEPSAGSRGRMFNENRKFVHVSEICKRKRPSNIVEFCNSCWKMAKNAPFHIKSPVKNVHGPAKGGGIAPWPSPKYATVYLLSLS